MVLMENELRILDESFTSFSYPIQIKDGQIRLIYLNGLPYTLVSSEQVDGEEHIIFQYNHWVSLTG